MELGLFTSEFLLLPIKLDDEVEEMDDKWLCTGDSGNEEGDTDGDEDESGGVDVEQSLSDVSTYKDCIFFSFLSVPF